MSPITALLDANVLYPAQMRDLFVQLAQDGLYQARWTNEIHSEWIEAVLRNEPRISRTALERTRGFMDDAVRNAPVTGYEDLIEALELPDRRDRHVLAAAIAGDCNLIVTQNLKDFPFETLAERRIMVTHPDDLLRHLLDSRTEDFCRSIRTILERLRNPSRTRTDYCDGLERMGLVTTARMLRDHIHRI